MTRFKAFLIHLGISAAIFLVLLYLIVFVWYPFPFFTADGGWQGIRIIAGVDLVLGPVLTFAVFRPGKKGLKFDLTLIGLVQTVALVFGTWLVYQEHTAVVTYVDGAFYSLNSKQVKTAEGKAAQVVAAATTTPPYAFVRLPDDKKARTDLIMQTVFAGWALHQLGDQYEALTPDNLREVFAHGLDINKYAQVSEENREKIDLFLKKHGGSASDYAFLPLYCRYTDVILVLSRQDGQVVDALAIWPQLPLPANTELAPLNHLTPKSKR